MEHIRPLKILPTGRISFKITQHQLSDCLGKVLSNDHQGGLSGEPDTSLKVASRTFSLKLLIMKREESSESPVFSLASCLGGYVHFKGDDRSPFNRSSFFNPRRPMAALCFMSHSLLCWKAVPPAPSHAPCSLGSLFQKMSHFT